MRVLFIGNANTTAHGLPDLVAQLCRGLGRPIEPVVAAEPGKHFGSHRDGPAAEQLASGGWDVCVLQEQALRPVREPKKFLSDGLHLHQLLLKSSPGAQTVLFCPWARKDGAAGEDCFAIQSSIVELERAISGVCRRADVGRVFRACKRDDLYAEDGQHCSPLGAYVAALVLASSILDASPLKAPSLQVPPAEAEQIRRRAATVLGFREEQAKVLPAPRPEPAAALGEARPARSRREKRQEDSDDDGGPIAPIGMDSYQRGEKNDMIETGASKKNLSCKERRRRQKGGGPELDEGMLAQLGGGEEDKPPPTTVVGYASAPAPKPKPVSRGPGQQQLEKSIVGDLFGGFAAPSAAPKPAAGKAALAAKLAKEKEERQLAEQKRLADEAKAKAEAEAEAEAAEARKEMEALRAQREKEQAKQRLKDEQAQQAQREREEEQQRREAEAAKAAKRKAEQDAAGALAAERRAKAEALDEAALQQNKEQQEEEVVVLESMYELERVGDKYRLEVPDLDGVAVTLHLPPGYPSVEPPRVEFSGLEEDEERYLRQQLEEQFSEAAGEVLLFGWLGEVQSVR